VREKPTPPAWCPPRMYADMRCTHARTVVLAPPVEANLLGPGESLAFGTAVESRRQRGWVWRVRFRAAPRIDIYSAVMHVQSAAMGRSAKSGGLAEKIGGGCGVRQRERECMGGGDMDAPLACGYVTICVCVCACVWPAARQRELGRSVCIRPVRGGR